MQETVGEQRVTQRAIPQVLVVLINWNEPDATLKAVGSLLKSDYPNFSVLIVDNGSSDDSRERLKAITGPHIELLEAGANTGYTGGANLGLKRGLERCVDYTWLLNNDAIVDPRTLSSLVATAESDATIGLVAPLLASLDEPRLTFAGGICSIEDKKYDETNDIEEARHWAKAYPGKELVLGTAMLVRMEMVRKIGLLDDRFFAYYDDMDYSVRSIAAGYRNVIDESRVVRHFEKNRNNHPLEMVPHYWYYMARNEPRFWRKHLGLRKSFRMMWNSFNAYLRHRSRCRLVPESGDAILAGIWHGWLNRSGAYDPKFRMPAPVAAMVKLYAWRFDGADESLLIGKPTELGLEQGFEAKELQLKRKADAA
jgi:GT2 family glycosyltransferase